MQTIAQCTNCTRKTVRTLCNVPIDEHCAMCYDVDTSREPPDSQPETVGNES